ncbi:protein mono-ADP-ribosyltransferase PARP16-like [Phlebotomus papatasi]|uniref:protein mono-ADP-ribosyltransferase PARP16-like n=1 Tax=Phlebotomus papatasi TaxID=29031 RepID=UPI002483DA04|nr:protein mono-ADP-ribosyltransferase PARP16-like [Phlebotomus papatasi]
MSRSPEKSLNQREKFQEVCNAIRSDPEASDLRVSLFSVASSRSYHQGMGLRPIPPNLSLTDDVDLEGLQHLLLKIPALEDLLNTKAEEMEAEIVDFLHWLLVQLTDPQVTRVKPIDARDVLQRFKWDRRELRPSHVFKVDYNPESSTEKKFQEHAREFPTNYAFHGSKAHNFHSILNFGLAQHLNKRSAFGEGLYIATDLSVSITYSPSESNWMHSQLGKRISCVALCEYVEHPVHLSCREMNKKSDVPKNTLVVSNNEIIRVRYLLLYGSSLPRKTLQTPEKSIIGWMRNHKATLLIISYAFILLAVNFTTSSTSWWTSLQNIMKRFLPSCCQ